MTKLQTDYARSGNEDSAKMMENIEMNHNEIKKDLEVDCHPEDVENGEEKDEKVGRYIIKRLIVIYVY